MNLTKILLSSVVIILSVLVVFITSSSTTNTSKDVRSHASAAITPNTVALILAPNEATYKVGDIFDVQIYVNTFSVKTSAVGARLFYDPSYLEVQQVTPGLIFGTYLANTFDQQSGTIYLSGEAFNSASGTAQSAFSGSGLLGTISFKAKTQTIGTELRFNFNPKDASINQSNVIDAKTTTNILEKVYNATLTITP